MKNIVYLHTHDTGRCISPCGFAVDTPNLAAFAREGALFRQAFDCGPTCSPARASLLTGTYPHQCGMLGLAHRGFRLNDPRKHLAAFLKRHGYRTVLCGVQHETADDPGTLGYEEVFEEGNRCGHSHGGMGSGLANTAAACAFLARRQETPFFLSLGLHATHRPFPESPDAADDPDFMRPPIPIPDTPECRRDWASFASMVRHVDRCFGRVLDTLTACGLREETLVLITTDHGPAFPGMKCTLSDHGCGVMFLLRVPGMPEGTVIDALISHLDFYPTVCEWAQLPAPEWLEGCSLFPLLRGEERELHEALYAEINFHAARDVQRSVRTRRFRYVRRYDGYAGTVLPNIDDGPTKRFLLREAELAEQPRIPVEQLFDLYRDPAESRSLLDDPASAGTLEKMRALLAEWQRRTRDSLPERLPHPPPGARLTRQSDPEPEPENGEWETVPESFDSGCGTVDCAVY